MMLKILHDTNNQGGNKNWKAKKLDSLELARYLNNNGYKSAARQVQGCCDVLMFATDNQGHKKLKKSWFCHNRLCNLCQDRKSILNYKRIKNVINGINFDQQKSEYIFVTFTSKNVPSSKVTSEIIKQNKALNKMFNYKALKTTVQGRVKANEVTYNATRNDYHVHSHVLMLVNRTITNGRHRINHKKWGAMWKKSLKTNYTPMIKMSSLRNSKNCTQQEQAIKVGNYISKAINYIQYINDFNIKDKDEVIKTIYQSVRNRQKISFSGAFRTADKAIINNHNKSMIRTRYKPKSEQFKPVKYQMYKWSAHYQDMVFKHDFDISEYDKYETP